MYVCTLGPSTLILEMVTPRYMECICSQAFANFSPFPPAALPFNICYSVDTAKRTEWSSDSDFGKWIWIPLNHSWWWNLPRGYLSDSQTHFELNILIFVSDFFLIAKWLCSSLLQNVNKIQSSRSCSRATDHSCFSMFTDRNILLNTFLGSKDSSSKWVKSPCAANK